MSEELPLRPSVPVVPGRCRLCAEPLVKLKTVVVCRVCDHTKDTRGLSIGPLCLKPVV
jgi:exosome complex RNA-binding protein Csl4